MSLDVEAQPSAGEWLSRLVQGDLSALELAQLCLQRIGAANEICNAVAERRDEAVLKEAKRADERRRDGSAAPPLLGLPVSIKDCIDVSGWRTASGSLAREHHVAAGEATVVARLRAAGAIPLVKTNVPECCCSFETDNLICGRTSNPLDPRRTPGGSSGGEAALLGSDASIVGIGSDGGGSIRVPSHYCGLPGLRPTVGRVPDTGSWPSTRASGTMDFTCVGPMARFVEDIALLLRVVMGADGIDPYAIDQPLPAFGREQVAGMRVGFYCEHPRVPTTTATTSGAVLQAAQALQEAGAHVEEIAPVQPEVEGRSATDLFFAASGADGGAALRRAVAGAGGRHHPQFSALLGDGLAPAPSAEEFFATQRRCFAFRAQVRAMFDDLDLILSPVVAGPAPPHGLPPAGIDPERYMRYEGFEYCHINAVAGVPAGTIPVAVEEGMPVGVQVAAGPYREDRVLSALASLEHAFGGFAINRRLAAGRVEAAQ